MKYDQVKTKQLSVNAEKQLEAEIEAKLSGIDDVLSKAFKSMNLIDANSKVEAPPKSSAEQLIEENKNIKKEEAVKKLNLNRDSLHRNFNSLY